MRKLLAGSCVLMGLVAVISSAAMAQEAPPPNKAPRTPVHRQTVVPNKEPIPANRQVQGAAMIMDAEKLRIGDTDLRLFGIVPPQLSASFGPQARAALDQIANGKEVTCQIRDRDREGRLLAVCKTPTSGDFAMELLQRGLAVTARGTLANTEFATPYIAAEMAAQEKRVGLWSVVVPNPVAVPETPKVEAKVEAPAPVVKPEAKEEKKEEKAAAKTKAEDAPVKAQPVAAIITKPAAEIAAPAAASHEPGFIARYQILIAGLLMLTTALSIIGTVVGYRRSEKRQEMRAIAAALRGELMAARAVCQARVKTIHSDEDDKAASWPRIRATLYQAYVGRIGWLGAELARQIASIYGQSSDYAAYYNNGDESRAETSPKKVALETLIRHIEAILPRLAMIEETGRLRAPIHAPSRPHMTSVAPVVTPATTPPSGTHAPAEPVAEGDITAVAAPNSAPVAQATSEEAPATSPIPLWKAMRNFTRERIHLAQKDSMEDHLPDYSALIEEEIESVGFSPEGEEAAEAITSNITRLRSNGG